MDLNPQRIQQLPPVIANQIAAGEVIEKPASVVKELLENALDAGADMITIDIGFGGLNQIKMSDNGVGIMAEDLPLAIQAHATSKIRQLGDLYSIKSMGFRGEALASIASVSHLTISSKPANQEYAMMLSCNGQNYQMHPCARNQGTTVDVRDLFCTAPVRKKFLKSAHSEYQSIESVVKRFALSAPHISITLNHNEKLMLHLPTATCEKSELSRIKKLLGKLFIEQSYYLDVERGNIRVKGWISNSDYQRSQNDKQWVYINQRMVKDKLIYHAIKQAYEDKLHPGRYPSCLLYFSLPPDDIDVNVHPTKHEVRFQQPRLIHDFILSAISSTYSKLSMSNVNSAFDIKMISDVDEFSDDYIQQPLSTAQRVTTARTANWFELNQNFVISFFQNVPYLINVKKLQQERLQTLLQQQSLPLAHRPLLVPLSFSIETFDVEQFQRKLALLGLQIDRIATTNVAVRTIPQLIPFLDIKMFLAKLSNNRSSPSDLLKLMVLSQSFDINQLDLENKQLLQEYIHEQFTIHPLPRWSLRLDQEKCRELIND